MREQHCASHGMSLTQHRLRRSFGKVDSQTRHEHTILFFKQKPSHLELFMQDKIIGPFEAERKAQVPECPDYQIPGNERRGVAMQHGRIRQAKADIKVAPRRVPFPAQLTTPFFLA